MAEFLPLCDVLFNVISLAGYFCDVVFDVVMGYALLERGYKATFAAAMSIIVTSLVVSQILSWRWYYGPMAGEARVPRGVWAPAALHCLQLGVLWRYARLFVPVDPRHVKHQVRDLCMLRLVHAFLEAAPMLLLQLHVLLAAPPELEPLPDGEPTRDEPAANKAFAELNVISASLSLFSVCWALASFSKNVRLQNVHRLVLTWLGVIFQFLWRLGTISARMCALTVYALAYEYWVFLVIGLHWVSMFLWLISPKNVFHGERISKPRKAYLSALIAFVYVFAYINLQELNHRQKMVTFYCVMCVENCLLVGAWAAAGRAGGAGGVGGAAPLFTLAAQAAGLLFMRAYYRYFHVRRLGYMLRENQQGTNSTNASSQNKNGKEQGQGDAAAIPGVFNCRFSNPVGSAANGRKKKKPTSFVPPPAAPAAPAAAFWRRPLPTTHNHHGGSSENEGSSVGSRVNIQQKLQEKKQKQLAELRVIEEEIKQGKLAKTAPVAVEEIYSSLQRQPIPRAKTHAEPPAWPRIDTTHSYQNYPVLPHTCNVYPTYTEIKTYDFQAPTETDDPIKTHRLLPRSVYSESRTLYENPANIRSEINRTPLRTYLVGETRTFENGCGSPRNVHGSSPRAYAADVSSGNSYERPTTTPLDKPRIPPYDGQEYNYCENNNQSYNKDEYVNNESIRPYEAAGNPRGPGFPARGGGGGGGGGPLEPLRLLQRCRTPEILLAPHYLEGCGRPVCCHWPGVAPYNASRKKEEGAASSGEGSGPEGVARDTPRPPSDIESQISLPRSYTLPREFRYWRRRPRLRDARAPSNNSSDGDVDSGDDSDRRSNCSATSQLQSPPYADGYTAYPPVHRHDPTRSQDEERRNPLENGPYSGCDRRRRGFRKQLAKPETKL